ncbi:hypothetical protein FOZ61_008354 [Perkinsus olseni]|uniref:Uncharacterized protein n=1 Tax=Perkinsus olseni TaxID=32597 RepID=A0A7J6L514_PEROL|nr:hypothetical protein FOZ61_008354 [Perkinsus olseni]KAF4657009.1 hypothetical protein FOL46_007594 [Perkinsus olseni]
MAFSCFVVYARMEILSSSSLKVNQRRSSSADGDHHGPEEESGELHSEGTQTVSSPDSPESGRSISSEGGDFGVKSHRFWRALKRVFAKDKMDDASTDTSSTKEEPKQENTRETADAGIEPAPFDDELSIGDEVPLDDRVYDPDDIISCLSAFSSSEDPPAK